MSSDQIKLGKQSMPIAGRNVILDSGLSYALIPSKDVKAISDHLQKSHGINCKIDSLEAKANKNLAFQNCEGCS